MLFVELVVQVGIGIEGLELAIGPPAIATLTKLTCGAAHRIE